MDFTPIFTSIAPYLLIFFTLAVFAGLINTPWFKGIAGEFIANTMAKLLLNSRDYTIINNVTLPSEDGTTQIDHIIVSVFGVFVIESKNMKGWIFGSKNIRIWTQQIYKHRNKFQNPLHQNYKHLKVLQSLLMLSDEQIFSVIVFVGDSEFKTNMPENVTHGIGYIRYIKSKTKPVLTPEEAKTIEIKIDTFRFAPTRATHKVHVKNLQSRFEED